MGLLIKGTWVPSVETTKELQDLLNRDANTLRDWITPDGRGFTADEGFKAEADRYHLYISMACPFAHRTSIMRHLKGLEGIVSMSEVDPLMLTDGWVFSEKYPDPLYGKSRLHEIYSESNSDLTSRVSVPVLWDRKRETIVSNDSGDIMRMFNAAFNQITGNTDDYYPAILRDDIEALNDWIFSNVNVGVYRAGFAETQLDYEQAAQTVFDALATIDSRLSERRFLHGEQITETDWRLFTTLVRFDAAYYGLFKLNQSHLTDYLHLSAYVRNLFQVNQVSETVDLAQIKLHYFGSFTSLNPSGLIPIGGETDFEEHHFRQDMKNTSVNRHLAAV